MQFITSVALLAGIAAAAPAACPNPSSSSEPRKFGLIAIRSGSPIQNVGITASKGSLFVGGNQDASCDKPSNFATFDVYDSEAYLYSESNPVQQLWVDQSGMGGGATGYTTGVQPLGRNYQQKGFEFDSDGTLVFDGTGAKACPGAEGEGWSLWFSNLDKPGFNEGCLDIALKPIYTDTPVGCEYSQSV